MKIDVFNPISFCFGVENSINMIKKATIEYKGRPIFCMGQPIHNELVTSELENLGITIIRKYERSTFFITDKELYDTFGIEFYEEEYYKKKKEN